MKGFESFLAPQIDHYLFYRFTLGYSIKTTIAHLKPFDRYLKENAIDNDLSLFTPSFFLEFRAKLKVAPRTVNEILSVTRMFFNYLVRKGYCPKNPLKDIPALPIADFIPFIFSPEQVDKLLAAVCRRLPDSQQNYLNALSIYLALVLLARCGLRISEPIKLLVTHYRYDEQTIYIEKTKFKKDRLIPVPISVAAEIENFMAVRKALLDKDENPYLLIGNQTQNVTDSQIRHAFHRSVYDIGLTLSRKTIGRTKFGSPTPHSLRHSFAVNTLLSVKERGKSPQNALPILGAYMGHSQYVYTAKYLKVLDARQRQRLADFAISHQEEI